MDKQFFHLRRHWIVAILASVAMLPAIVWSSHQKDASMIIFQMAVLALFVQFVWSGAFAIAALLSAQRSYFFSLTLLCIYTLSALCAGVFLLLA